MRGVILAVAFLAVMGAGCGQQQDEAAPVSVDLNGSRIINEGPLNSHLYSMQSEVWHTMNCLRTNYPGTLREDEPYIVIIDGPMICGTNNHSFGCYAPGVDIIYLTVKTHADYPYQSGLLGHEVAHRATGIGNEGHDTQLFNTCAPLVMRDGFILYTRS